ncbi:MAG: M28 family peptidase [Pyrinomonadaceae bacterium]
MLFWVSQPLLSKQVNTVETANSERLRTHVEKLSNDLYPRNHLNLQNLNLAADYIRSEFEKTGGKVSEQSFRVNGSDYRNVILTLAEGREPRMIVGAHYDAAYQTYGADDNASGVAGLIELANLLSKEQLGKQVDLVAYSLEEPPYFGTDQMGSYVHAKSLFDSGAPVKLMVCLEMIGFYTDEPNSQNFPLILGRLLYPSKGNFVAAVGNFSNAMTTRSFKYSMSSVEGLDTYSLNAPAQIGGTDLSDHRNYWNFGFDALMVTDTAFFRNKAYHTVGDTADQLDYVKMAKVVDAVKTGLIEASK